MKQLSERPPVRPRARRTRPDAAQRIESARAIVGYGEEERWRVRLSSELVVAAAASIAQAMERRMEAHAGVSFDLPRNGAAPASSTHAEAVRAWLAGLDDPLSAESAERLQEIARAHTSRGGNAGTRVAAHYVALAFGVLQDEIARVLGGAIDDSNELAQTITAWNKLLMTQLDTFLDVYDGLEGRLHWY